ncbi:MAG: squalene/phytoene synthase family protein [Planctomycetes bacterium]|nr:squalene/phytoene synthase family protein [Planctomycetota bacterium]
MIPEAARLTPEEIARRSKSNFLASFVFLERRRRRALSAIYAFCRAVDDAADEPKDPVEAREQLAFWRAELAAVERGAPQTATGRALCELALPYGTSVRHLEEVLDGVSMDVEPRRYADLPALDAYCHKVASAVGLACLPVFGAHGRQADDYARELGLALQLTNVLRDVPRDAAEGRIYLPTDALDRHAVDVDWLAGRGPADAYAPGGPVDALVRELVAVAEQRFARTATLLPEDQRRALLPAEIMAAIYHALLQRVAARGGRLDVAARPRVSRRRKLGIVLRTWWRNGRR